MAAEESPEQDLSPNLSQLSMTTIQESPPQDPARDRPRSTTPVQDLTRRERTPGNTPPARRRLVLFAGQAYQGIASSNPHRATTRLLSTLSDASPRDSVYGTRHPFDFSLSQPEETLARTDATEALRLQTEDLVFRTVRTNAGRNRDVSAMTPLELSFLVPRDIDAEQHATLREICNGRQAYISDAKLARALQLDEWQEGQRPVGTHMFYLRSWSLSADEVAMLLASLEETTSPENEQLRAWQMAVQLNVGMSIRYVGTCQSPRTPADRLRQDESRGALYGAFRDALQHVCPDLRPRIWHFRLADLQPLPHRLLKLTPQTREAAIIALFALATLLNVDAGGEHTTMPPELNDDSDFRAVRSHFFARMRRTARPANESLREIVDGIGDDVVRFCEAHPALTRTEGRPLDAAYVRAIKEDMIPLQYQGQTVMAILADKPPLAVLQRPQRFFEEESMTSTTMRNYLGSIENWEEARGPTVHSRAAPKWLPSVIPFKDLYPTDTPEPKVFARQSALAWAAAIEPYIILGMGQDSSRVLAANLLHSNSFSSKDYHLFVGEIRKMRYSSPDWIDDPNPDARPDPGTSAILVPILHPGYIKYGNDFAPVRKLLMLGLKIAVVLAHQVQNYIDENLAHDDVVNLTLCWFTNHESTRNLRDSLVQVKADFIRHLAEKAEARQPMDETFRHNPEYLATRAALASDRVVFGAYAEGRVGTRTRTLQAQRLWRLELSDLHITVPRSQKVE